MGIATHNNMGTMETMVAGCICGIVFALFSGQPLIILGSTGPVLVFEKILVHFCEYRTLFLTEKERFLSEDWLLICPCIQNI